MKGSQSKQTDEAADWVTQLQKPIKISELSPLAQRLIFSLRLIAVYRKAGKDPFAELASRLGSLVVAAKSLQLVEALAHAWPDPVQVRRCCCQLVSHDEVTIARALQAVANRERANFDRQLVGLLPHEAQIDIWTAANELVAAEFA